jgi:DNA-binding PadR family transcriptional regulator
MLEVRERTGGRVRLGPGTLYGAIKRLKEGGVIEESAKRPDPGEAPDDERRRYYRLSAVPGLRARAADPARAARSRR